MRAAFLRYLLNADISRGNQSNTAGVLWAFLQNFAGKALFL